MRKRKQAKNNALQSVPRPAILTAGFGTLILECVAEIKINGNLHVARLDLGELQCIVHLGDQSSFPVCADEIRDLFRQRKLVVQTWTGPADLELVKVQAPPKILEAVLQSHAEPLLYGKNEKMYSRHNGKYLGTYQGRAKNGSHMVLFKDKMQGYALEDIGTKNEVPASH